MLSDSLRCFDLCRKLMKEKSRREISVFNHHKVVAGSAWSRTLSLWNLGAHFMSVMDAHKPANFKPLKKFRKKESFFVFSHVSVGYSKSFCLMKTAELPAKYFTEMARVGIWNTSTLPLSGSSQFCQQVFCQTRLWSDEAYLLLLGRIFHSQVIPVKPMRQQEVDSCLIFWDWLRMENLQIKIFLDKNWKEFIICRHKCWVEYLNMPKQ